MQYKDFKQIRCIHGKRVLLTKKTESPLWLSIIIYGLPVKQPAGCVNTCRHSYASYINTRCTRYLISALYTTTDCC